MNRKPIRSIFFKSLAYYPAQETLEVELHNGDVSLYFVPIKVFQAMMRSPFPGLHFRLLIEHKAKWLAKRRLKFLDHNVFYGLKNINAGFDIKTVKYFSKEDFGKILDRISSFEISIYGIEAWPNEKYGGSETYENYGRPASDPVWYKNAFQKLQEQGMTSHFSASYGIPGKLLAKTMIIKLENYSHA